MLYDIFTGSFSIADGLIKLGSILGSKAFPDFNAAVKFFTNFIENIKLVLGDNITLGRIIRIIPDFASMLISIIPGANIVKIIASIYDIGTVL